MSNRWNADYDDDDVVVVDNAIRSTESENTVVNIVYESFVSMERRKNTVVNIVSESFM